MENEVAHTPTEEQRVIAQLQQSEVFRGYKAAYESATTLPLNLRARGSFLAPMHGSRALNPFCALMAATNKTCAACLQLQQAVEQSSEEGVQTAECFAGLAESAVPVRVGNKTLGYLQTGQVFLRPPTKARFAKTIEQLRAWNKDLDVPSLEKAYFATRVFNRAQYDSMVQLISIFAQQLAAMSNQIVVKESNTELPALNRARQYIASHHHEDITLEDVAKVAAMSTFYFCKMFRKATGVTFTEYVARTRVETVKQLLLNPHTRISEAAFEAGFQSLSQFNRVFQRIEGESPTAHRDRIHAERRLSA